MDIKEELRNYVRELLLKKKVVEIDALFDKKKDWKEEIAILKSNMNSLIQHIEDDSYVEGIKQIDVVVEKLKHWKSKIEKHLNS